MKIAFTLCSNNYLAAAFYFRHFFGQGATEVIYLDPDIEILGRLEEVLKACRPR